MPRQQGVPCLKQIGHVSMVHVSCPGGRASDIPAEHHAEHSAEVPRRGVAGTGDAGVAVHRDGRPVRGGRLWPVRAAQLRFRGQRHAGRATLIAKTLSFIAGTTTAYPINRRWTFQAEPSRARFIAVVILYAVTSDCRSASISCSICNSRAKAAAGGLCHRPGHGDSDQLRGAASRDFPVEVTLAGTL